MIQVILADSSKKAINSILSLLDSEPLSLEVVATATTGEELLNQIHVFRPELVIMDTSFADKPGFDVIREVGGYLTRFLIVSEDTSFQNMRKAIQLKVEDYLQKPLNRPELNLAVRTIISRMQTIDYNSYSKVIALAKSYVDLHYSHHITLEEVAEEAFVSASYLCGLFRKELGINFKEYLVQLRMREACRLLNDQRYSISQIGSMVGYKNTRYFRELFIQHTGMTPSHYRKR